MRIHPTVHLAVLAAALLWPATPGLAQETEEKGESKPQLTEVAERIGRAGEVNCLLGYGLDEKEVVFEESGSWRQDLYNVAEKMDCRVWPLGGETFVVYASPPLSFDFDGADAYVVLDLAARNSASGLLVFSGLSDSLDIHMRDESADAIFSFVATELNLVVLRERGWIFRISTPEHERRVSARPLPVETLNALGLGYSRPENRKRVSLDVKGDKPSTAIRQVSEAVGLAIGVDEKLDEEPITLKLVNAPWREALEAIAWKAGATLWDDGKGSVSVRRIPRLNMEFVDADVRIVVDLIARNSGVSLEVGEDVYGGCGLNTRSTRWRDLLFSLSRKHPFHLRVKPDGTFVAEAF